MHSRCANNQLEPNISVNLPPYPYCRHLLDQLEIYLGHDYHWFLRRRFKERVELTYKNPVSSESKDRFWLCQLLIVFALGETFVNWYAPVIHLGSTSSAEVGGIEETDRRSNVATAPGATFFEQALVLLKLPYEEPCVEHVETLNLAVSLRLFLYYYPPLIFPYYLCNFVSD